MDLSGPWRFCPDPFRDGDAAGYFGPDFDDSAWPVTELPNVFDRMLPSLASYEGVVWFRRNVRVNAIWALPVLRLASVNARVEVFWNGVSVGGSDDPFLPVEILLLGHLRTGANDVVTLRIDNRRRKDEVPGLQRGWRPYGGVLGGIEIVGRNPIYIQSVQVEASADRRLRCRVCVVNRGSFAQEIVASVEACSSESASSDASVEKPVAAWRSAPTPIGVGDTVVFDWGETVSEASLWSPDAPNLYTALVGVDVAVRSKSDLRSEPDPRNQRRFVDRRPVVFGFRTIAVEDGLITLNGTPVFLRGFNRHQDSPTRDMAADPELARADLLAMKEAGANFVRLCHYPHDPSTLDLCDELGLLALCEIPLYWWGNRDEDHAAKLDAATRQLTKLIARDRNHPSVILWSVSNETYEHIPEVAAGNQALVRLAKELDPARLAVHVSHDWRTTPSFAGDDVLCVNGYPTQGGRAGWEPAWPWPDALATLRARYPDKPIVVTEFGYPGLAGVASGSGGERQWRRGGAGGRDPERVARSHPRRRCLRRRTLVLGRPRLAGGPLAPARHHQPVRRRRT